MPKNSSILNISRQRFYLPISNNILDTIKSAPPNKNVNKISKYLSVDTTSNTFFRFAIMTNYSRVDSFSQNIITTKLFQNVHFQIWPVDKSFMNNLSSLFIVKSITFPAEKKKKKENQKFYRNSYDCNQDFLNIFKLPKEWILALGWCIIRIWFVIFQITPRDVL